MGEAISSESVADILARRIRVSLELHFAERQPALLTRREISCGAHPLALGWGTRPIHRRPACRADLDGCLGWGTRPI